MMGGGLVRLRAAIVLFGLMGAVSCGGAEPERGAAIGEAARPSFTVRLDDASATVADYHLVEDDDGIRIQTGPAGIAYRSDDLVESGDFSLETTFLLYDAPVGYREAFGIFVGGRELDGPGQEYTYLLIRPTGDFLIKRRVGESTETIADWSAHTAVRAVTDDVAEPLNTLAIHVSEGEARFEVNGVVVHALDAARARPFGIAGVRVNHRLDVRVDNWVLASAEPAS